ncbi:SusD family [Dorea longicatena]|nr:SusD family [Dorea longicatena]
MRYAEVLLLAAEANLKDGNQSEADACLNEVRQRARLDAKTATLDAIKLEKRLELCSEYTRYQDIIRWKDAEALLKDQGERTPIFKGNPLESEYGTKCRLVKRIKNQNLTSSSDADRQN